VENIESNRNSGNKDFDCIGDGWAPAGIDEHVPPGATKHSVFMRHLIGCRPGHLVAATAKSSTWVTAPSGKQAQDWVDEPFGNVRATTSKRTCFIPPPLSPATRQSFSSPLRRRMP
jgi:hypothetical protein